MTDWQQGRQNSGYRRFRLGQRKILNVWLDAYLLDCDPGVQIKTHIDPVRGKRHLRLNIRLSPGEFIFTATNIIFERWGLCLFRSDQPHSFTNFEQRTIFLSIGFVY